MDLAGQSLVVWLSPETIERFLGVLESRDERAMASWVQFLFLALAILCLLCLFS